MLPNETEMEAQASFFERQLNSRTKVGGSYLNIDDLWVIDCFVDPCGISKYSRATKTQ